LVGCDRANRGLSGTTQRYEGVVATFRISDAFTDGVRAAGHDPLYGITEVSEIMLSGPAFKTAPALADGVLTSVLGQSALDAAGGVFKTALSGPAFKTAPGLSLGVADGVLKSVLGSIDIDQMVERLSALAEEDPASAFLTRERARQLWGYYIYVMVWAVCLLVVLHVMSLNQTSSTLLGLTTTMTGLSGHAVASRARKIGLDRFDRRYPPDSKTAPSINILI
jgi:hypothetical protein